MHVAHRAALRRQRIGKAVQRFELVIVAGPELQVLAGVILRRLHRLGQICSGRICTLLLSRVNSRAVSACCCRPTDTTDRVDRRQSPVHVAFVGDVLRRPQPLRHREGTRPQLEIEQRRAHVFRPQRRFAAENVGLPFLVRHHRHLARRHRRQLVAAGGVTHVADQRIAAELVLLQREHRPRVAHPVSTRNVTCCGVRQTMSCTARRDLPLKSIKPRQPCLPSISVKLPSTALPFRRGMLKRQLCACSPGCTAVSIPSGCGRISLR